MNRYEIRNTQSVISPCLIYYRDMIRDNIEKAIKQAGGVERLWPHVKSHKSMDMVRLQMEYGITKFKTATIAEAEMAAEAGAKKVLLAYPLVGPGIKRYINLAKAYPKTCFYGIGDDLLQLQELSQQCVEQEWKLKILADVNMGMNRTGVELAELEEFYRKAVMLPGISMVGMHCYDGNHNASDIQIRRKEVGESDTRIKEIMDRLKKDGIFCEFAVAGGTPSFPCHADETEWYLSPGTAFITDAGYYKNLPDLDFIPAAAVMTRVISHPAPDMFTLDLGYKGIAADPPGQRGYIVGFEDAVSVVHSEEHWAFKWTQGEIPLIGACLYVIPTHICPTSALYPAVWVAENGEIVDQWEITARNRKINF